jgi:hypothetical protein
MRPSFLLIPVILLMFNYSRVEAFPVIAIVKTTTTICNIVSNAKKVYNVYQSLIQVRDQYQKATSLSGLLMLANQKNDGTDFSYQFQKLQSSLSQQNERINQKLDVLSQKMDVIYESVQQQNQEIKKLFTQFDAQMKEIKDVKRLIELSQIAEFKAAVASFEVGIDLLKQDPNAHPAEMANALEGFIKSEVYIDDKIQQGQMIAIEQQATIYFYLISCYLYAKNINQVKTYASLLLHVPVENETLDQIQQTTVKTIKLLKEEYENNLEDSIKISEINREIKKYKSAKLNTSKYQEIYADRSKLILAYKSFAKEILKDELKLSDDEIKDLQFTQEYQQKQQGLEFEIMYKLAYQYQKEMDQTK